MTGFEKQTYTQVPNSLFEIMHEMDECELKVVLYICRYTFGYHRDEVKISNRKLAQAIKMSTASVEKGAASAEARGLIERLVDGQNTTVWRAVVSDSEIDTPVLGVSKIDTPVSQNLIRGVSENEAQVGVKERINKLQKKNIIINPVTAKLFLDAFGHFNSQHEQERWGALYDSVGPERAAELIVWAEKKEIHLANRPSLIDALETAAKKWQTSAQRKQTAAQRGDHRAYVEGQYADFIEH